MNRVNTFSVPWKSKRLYANGVQLEETGQIETIIVNEFA